MRFAIWYSDQVLYGDGKDDWLIFPDDDVQVVVVEGPPTEPKPDRFKTGFVGCGRTDKTFYTGVDEYDPLNTGHVKYGRLILDSAYWSIWNRAYGDR